MAARCVSNECPIIQMNISEKHLQKIGGFLQEIYHLQDIASLRAKICRKLGELIDGHNIFIGSHDMRQTLITGCVVTHPFQTPDFIDIVNRCVGEHPLWEPIREGGAEVRCISRFATAQAWENTMLYREALGLEGVKDHLTIEFGDRREHLTSVGIFRDSHGFSDRDLATMQLLMPHLGQAMENARIAEASGLIGDLADDAFAIIDRDGRLLHVPAKVAAAFGGNGGSPLAPVCRWMAESAATLRRGALEVTLKPLRIRHAGRTFAMRMYHNHGGGGFRIMVRVSGDGHVILTPREWDVLRWIREGKTNEETAIILNLKITTVKTHVRSILHKLGVENRVAAARFPLESIRRG